MGVLERLAAAGMALPAVPAAAGSYVPAVLVGDFVFTSGQLPLEDGVLLAKGTVGEGSDVKVARRCAERCALNALAAAASVVDLDRVSRVVKVVGYVASGEGFTEQPSVIDGASSVMAVAFGESGAHAREAVGVARLPLDAPVEVSLVLSLV